MATSHSLQWRFKIACVNDDADASAVVILKLEMEESNSVSQIIQICMDLF